MVVAIAACTAIGCGLNPRPEDPSLEPESVIDLGDNGRSQTGGGGASSEANGGGSGGAGDLIDFGDGGTGSPAQEGISDAGADASGGNDGDKDAGDAQPPLDGSSDVVAD